MTATLNDMLPRATWQMQVLGRPSGTLSLYETLQGLVWCWHDKPAHLVPLLGVWQEQDNRKPWLFFEAEAAVQHVMDCTGIAFSGQCSLTTQ